jgi:hypothetical protein
VRERAHVVALVFDNGRYGTIWRHQEQRGEEAGLATNLGPIDFAAVANAAGALGLTVSTDSEFEAALRQAMEAGRPAVLHLALDPSWTTPEAAAGEVLPEPMEQANAAPSATSEEAVEEALIEEAVAETIEEVLIEEALIEEAVAETIEEVLIEEAVEEAVEEALIEEAVAETIEEVLIEEAVAEEIPAETVAGAEIPAAEPTAE